MLPPLPLPLESFEIVRTEDLSYRKVFEGGCQTHTPVDFLREHNHTGWRRFVRRLAPSDVYLGLEECLAGIHKMPLFLSLLEYCIMTFQLLLPAINHPGELGMREKRIAESNIE
jgi:hypothetical protein